MKRRALLAAAAMAPVVALSACSTSSTSTTGTSAGASAAEVSFPVTIKHSFGETSIPADPKRVVTVGWSDQDSVAALGVVPVGATKTSWGGNDNGSTDWFDAKIKELGGEAPTRFDESDGIPVDEIAKLRPDLILGVQSGMDKATYEKLTKIAPTVAPPGAAWGTPWRDQLRIVGEALGRPKAAADLLAGAEKLFADTKAKYPELQDKSVLWSSFDKDTSKISFYTTTDVRPTVLREFGMKDPEFVTKESKPGVFYTNVSAERAATLKSDIIIFYVDPNSPLKSVLGDPLRKKIPAIADKHYLADNDPVVSNAFSSASVLSLPVAAEKFLPKIAAAAKGDVQQ